LKRTLRAVVLNKAWLKLYCRRELS
jgi:hypothetical protein